MDLRLDTPIAVQATGHKGAAGTVDIEIDTSEMFQQFLTGEEFPEEE